MNIDGPYERGWRAATSPRRGGRPAHPNLEPFHQGELDSLCGIYAIINAIKRATTGEHAIEHSAWPWLFAELLRELDVLVGTAYAAAYGIPTKPLWKLSKRGSTCPLARRGGLRPTRGRARRL